MPLGRGPRGGLPTRNMQRGSLPVEVEVSSGFDGVVGDEW
jgi:hypothetical protein